MFTKVCCHHLYPAPVRQLPLEVLAHLHHVLGVQQHGVQLVILAALLERLENDDGGVFGTQLLNVFPVLEHLRIDDWSFKVQTLVIYHD